MVALVFDYINGFHDAANSVATIVSTRVLTPFQAVLWAAFFNFVSAFSFRDRSGQDRRHGMVDLIYVTPYVILGGLMGAIVWDLITWWLGLPTSSSHALIGGYAGAAMAQVALPARHRPLLRRHRRERLDHDLALHGCCPADRPGARRTS